MHDELPAGKARFKIFRGSEAPSIEASGVEKHQPDQPSLPAVVLDALAASADHGYSHRVLFAEQGMSLLHLWFKSGFILPLHSHDTDCTYFILAGSVRIGTTDLRAGDGFFVGAEVPYTYAAGSAGAEVLEFRAAEEFYLNVLVKNSAFWDRFSDILRSKQSAWPNERRPSQVFS